MRIYHFWSSEWPRTRELVREFAPEAEWVWTGRDQFHYYEELSRRWTGEDDIITIEHDMELRGDCIPSFKACSGLWCSFGYFTGPLGTGDTGFGIIASRSLGVTKYSAELQRMFPVEKWDCPVRPVRWQDIDLCIARAVEAGGINVHKHEPTVRHYHYEEELPPVTCSGGVKIKPPGAHFG